MDGWGALKHWPPKSKSSHELRIGCGSQLHIYIIYMNNLYDVYNGACMDYKMPTSQQFVSACFVCSVLNGLLQGRQRWHGKKKPWRDLCRHPRHPSHTRNVRWGPRPISYHEIASYVFLAMHVGPGMSPHVHVCRLKRTVPGSRRNPESLTSRISSL